MITDPSIGAATQFKPGRTGNPNGRPKTRHLTELLGAELAKTASKNGQTREQRLVERLVSIALTGKRGEALAAMKLIFAYRDGLPVQPVEHDFYDALRRAAEARGADPDRVINLFEHMKRQRTG